MHHTTGPISPAGPLVEVIVKIPLCIVKVRSAQGIAIPPGVREMALIDTGSTSSLVHIGIIQTLGLKVRDLVRLGSPTSGALPVIVRRYDVGVAIMMNPSPYLIDPLRMGAIDLSGRPFKVVLGMDVLKQGLFTLDGRNGTYSLEF